MMTESSITKKGQTTLPKSVREFLGLRAGDKLRYFITNGEVRIMPVRSVKRLCGALQYDGPTVTLEEMEQAIGDGTCEVSETTENS